MAVLLFLGMAVCSPSARAQEGIGRRPAGLSAAINKGAAKVGDIVELTLKYTLPKGASLPESPEVKGLENLTIVDRRHGQGTLSFRLLVDKLDSWATGPLSIRYLDREGKAQTLTTDFVAVKVLSNLGEKPQEAELRPIQGVIPIQTRWRRMMPWAAGAAALLLAGVGCWRFFLRKHRVSDIVAEAFEPPPLRARRELEDLESQKLFESGQIKAYYFRFSEILRHYLEALKGFPAAEFTTEEIALRLDREEDRKLLPLLRQADLVKFADSVPTPARKEETLKTARTYIRETGIVWEQGFHSQERGIGRRNPHAPEIEQARFSAR
jgi:hypothetical protein